MIIIICTCYKHNTQQHPTHKNRLTIPLIQKFTLIRGPQPTLGGLQTLVHTWADFSAPTVRMSDVPANLLSSPTDSLYKLRPKLSQTLQSSVAPEEARCWRNIVRL